MANKRKAAVTAVVIAMLFTCASFARAQSSTDSAQPSQDVKTPPPNIAGEWTGTVTDDGVLGHGDLDFEFTQKKNVFGGTWDIPDHDYMGTVVDGIVNGKKGKVTFKLKASGSRCTIKATAELSDDDTTMTGNYVESTKHCSYHFHGTFSVSLAP